MATSESQPELMSTSHLLAPSIGQVYHHIDLSHTGTLLMKNNTLPFMLRMVFSISSLSTKPLNTY